MGILYNLKEFIFGRKKKENDEIRAAMERINPCKFFQELADYAQSLGFTVAEGIRDTGFSSGTNYAVHGIQFRMYGMIVAVVGLNTLLTDRYTAGIYYTSGEKSGGFTGPFSITTLNKCKEDLDKLVVRLKEKEQQIKLESINEDFV